MEINIYDHFRMTESFKTMNHFSESIKIRAQNFDTIIIQVFNLCHKKFEIDIFDTLEIMRFSAT